VSLYIIKADLCHFRAFRVSPETKLRDLAIATTQQLVSNLLKSTRGIAVALLTEGSILSLDASIQATIAL
jgi:hypothetical protein